MSLFDRSHDPETIEQRSQNEISAVIYGALLTLIVVALLVMASTGLLTQ